MGEEERSKACETREVRELLQPASGLGLVFLMLAKHIYVSVISGGGCYVAVILKNALQTVKLVSANQQVRARRSGEACETREVWALLQPACGVSVV